MQLRKIYELVAKAITGPADLMEAALTDSASGVRKHMGKAAVGNPQYNSECLGVAAENKNYKAFNEILRVSGESSMGFITTPLTLAYGAGWDRAQELAKTDPEIAKGFAMYDRLVETAHEQFERDFKEFAAASDAREAAAKAAKPSAPGSRR